jgi:hydrogenase nickel incorporation protein HypB
MKKIVTIRRKALAASEEQAKKLRERFSASKTLVLNLISSPGSGKTTLLETTVGRMADSFKMAVIEGDVATERDADRIRAMGVPAHQILTSGACHLDARQIENALDTTDLMPAEILIIENVGNLICPTTYDLGEDFKVALLSVTEGDDKPIKYPAIFSRSDVTVITKSDLLPYVPFDLDTVKAHIATLNPSGVILVVSSTSGEGIDSWCDLIASRFEAKQRP